MNLPFVKMSPAQNVTILVNCPVPHSLHTRIAEQLLTYDGIGGEQVGYLEPPQNPSAHIRLQMMGGEFCGNASMCTATFLAWKQNLQKIDCLIEVSGTETLVSCHAEAQNDDYFASVEMPLPLDVTETTLPLNDRTDIRLVTVHFPGISHIVAPASFSAEQAETLIRRWQHALNVPALGILRFDETNMQFEPLVYVAATDTAVWEHGCGSGTAAIGCMYASQNGTAALKLNQPGGQIAVEARSENGKITQLKISTKVKITVAGTAFVKE